jgi:hypothetical protein
MSLEYNSAYHLRCQIALRSGRRVKLQSLHQWMTYAGWLEGVPSGDLNDGFVEGSLRDSERYCIEGAKPILIVPARRDYLRRPGDMGGHRSLGGQPAEWLPMVTCVGVLRDTAPARDRGKDCSMLTVAWFQDEFALPIDESVLEHLQSIDWEQLAADIEL